MRLNHPSGQAAEDTAAHFLEKQGCRIIARNWHCPFGEIDLIAEQSGTLLFVEVKYRRSAAFGGTAYSITPNWPNCKKARNTTCNSTAKGVRTAVWMPS